MGLFGSKKDKSKAHIKIEKPHRYSKSVRTTTIIGSSVMAFLGVCCITAFILISSVLNKVNFSGNHDYDPNSNIDFEDDTDIDGVTVDPSEYENAQSVADIPLRGNQKSIRNILLLGIDGQTFSGRSDTMIIMSINDKTKTIKLISLLRDTWVSVPGRDKNGDGKDDYCKLNESYAYGGHALLNKTIQQNFRLDIDQYIGVNFKVLPIIIDSLGGLDIELTAREMTQIPAAGCKVSVTWEGFVPLTGKPGVHHLDGFQSMEYARIRKIDSDFYRTARQRKVVSLLIDKAKDMSYTQLISIMYKALSYVDTNMSSDEFLAFAANAVKYTSYDVNTSYHVPQDKAYKGTYIDKKSGLLMIDAKKSVQELHQFIYS